jgi:hypothetical protein
VDGTGRARFEALFQYLQRGTLENHIRTVGPGSGTKSEATVQTNQKRASIYVYTCTGVRSLTTCSWDYFESEVLMNGGPICNGL